MSDPTDKKDEDTFSKGQTMFAAISTGVFGVGLGALGTTALLNDKVTITIGGSDNQTKQAPANKNRDSASQFRFSDYLTFGSDDVDLPVTLKVQSDTAARDDYAPQKACALSVHAEDAFGNTMKATKHPNGSLTSENNIPSYGNKAITSVVFTGCAQEYGGEEVSCTSDKLLDFTKNVISSDLLPQKLLEGTIRQKFLEKNGGECWKTGTQQAYSVEKFEIDDSYVMG